MALASEVDRPVRSRTISTINRSYTLDDLKVDIIGRDAKNKWLGKHLEIDVSVSAPNLDNYTGLTRHFELAPTLILGGAYDTRKNKTRLRQKAMEVSISAFNELLKYRKYYDLPNLQIADDYLKFVGKLERELVGIVDYNEPDGAGHC